MTLLSSQHSSTLKRWETVERTELARYRIFDLHVVRRRNPQRGSVGEFVVLRTAPWVNIIPLTEHGKVVLVRQYRHGSDSVTLEFPGGVVATGEDPAQAAMRECLEETGYGSNPMALELVGTQLPNPAFLETICYTYAWRGCRYLQKPQWDEHEIIDVVEVPVENMDQLIATGAIQHSIIIAAWTLFRLHATTLHNLSGGSDGQSSGNC